MARWIIFNVDTGLRREFPVIFPVNGNLQSMDQRGMVQHGEVGALLRCLHYIETYFGDAASAHFEDAGRAIGKVDDAVGGDRSSIVDSYQHPTMVAEVRHLHPATQSQGAMGGREFVHVKGFTARSSFAVEGFAVPGCRANRKRQWGFCAWLRLLLRGTL
jgi:hypothetical protein